MNTDLSQLTDYIPYLALTVGIISIFTNTENRTYKSLLISLLITLQVGICLLEVEKNVNAKNEAEAKAKNLRSKIETFEASTQVNFNEVIKAIEEHSSLNDTAQIFYMTFYDKRVQVKNNIFSTLKTTTKPSSPTQTISTLNADDNNINSDTALKATNAVNEGFAYYGITGYLGSPDDSWHERYFDNLTNSKEDFPKRGDVVKAINDVNIREGYIKLINDKSGYSDYVNERAIGLIKTGDKLKVTEVKTIADFFIWVKFERIL